LPWHEAVGIFIQGSRATGVEARRREHGGERTISLECDFIINAAGAWAGRIGELAGIKVPISPAAGAMAAVKGRLVNRVVSRLRPPGDGDILVPQRGLTIIGSTQRFAESPEGLLPLPEETTFLHAEAGLMVPAFREKPVYAAWSAARPLAGFRTGDDVEGRSLSRDFAVVDHEDEGIAGMATIVGGKATVLRAMGEKTADFVCRKLGVREPCRTAEFLLPSWREYYRGRNP
jgi:glycerol-3-phosphate dehydrogenase